MSAVWIGLGWLGACFVLGVGLAFVLPRRRDAQARRDREALRATWSRSRNGGL